MSARPGHDVVERLFFDEDPSRRRGPWLRREVRRLVVREFRCSGAARDKHLLAVVLRTLWGHWATWHEAGLPLDVWTQEWLDLTPDHIEATCHCGGVRRVNLGEVRAMR